MCAGLIGDHIRLEAELHELRHDIGDVRDQADRPCGLGPRALLQPLQRIIEIIGDLVEIFCFQPPLHTTGIDLDTKDRRPGEFRTLTNVFQIDLPDTTTGACPAGTIPVYRVFNQKKDSNHRYTTSAAIRATMEAQGWKREGYGPDATIMCAIAP